MTTIPLEPPRWKRLRIKLLLCNSILKVSLQERVLGRVNPRLSSVEACVVAMAWPWPTRKTPRMLSNLWVKSAIYPNTTWRWRVISRLIPTSDHHHCPLTEAARGRTEGTSTILAWILRCQICHSWRTLFWLPNYQWTLTNLTSWNSFYHCNFPCNFHLLFCFRKCWAALRNLQENKKRRE